MSRIGRLPITIPAGVDVTIDGDRVSVKGPKGQLEHSLPTPITATLEEGQVTVARPDPYKGKGVRYAGEQIRRKAGKAGK